MAGKPGRSGTNKGKDKPWSDAIRRAMHRTLEDGKTKRLDALANKLLDRALDGDVAALKEFGDRIDGKPSQQLEHTGEAGGPILIRTGVPRAGD